MFALEMGASLNIIHTACIWLTGVYKVNHLYFHMQLFVEKEMHDIRCSYSKALFCNKDYIAAARTVKKQSSCENIYSPHMVFVYSLLSMLPASRLI